MKTQTIELDLKIVLENSVTNLSKTYESKIMLTYMVTIFVSQEPIEQANEGTSTDNSSTDSQTGASTSTTTTNITTEETTQVEGTFTNVDES